MIPAEWHLELQQHISQRYRLGNLPHAVLVHGAQGLGKAHVVRNMCQALLCQKPLANQQACGECQACSLFNAGTHPNYTYIAPEKNIEKKTQSPIKIDQIRDLSAKLVMTSQYEGPNIAVIEQADAMNHFAANALLKTLEEPTSNTIIFLMTHQLSHLLPTIRSRCQSYLLSKPQESDAVTWLMGATELSKQESEQALQIADGSPLMALAFIESGFIQSRSVFVEMLSSLFVNQCTIAQVSAQAAELEFKRCASLLQSILLDIAILLQSNGDTAQIKNKDLHKWVRKLAAMLNQQQLYELYDQLNVMIKLDNPSINTQLALESFLSAWHNAVINNQKTA